MSSVNVDWIDHRNNFSISFEDLLQSDELVDVKLVAEGHLISAHRLVLSTMSPYFRNMFTQMPVNQQAFVFLKDISKQTIESLMTFIYRGEVNVKKEHLDDFMSAAFALSVKGLADGGYSQSFDSRPFNSTPAEPSFNGAAYQTTDFSHRFGSPRVQYQSVQRSVQSSHYQQPMNECQEQDNFASENDCNSFSAQNADDGTSSNNKNYSMTGEDGAPFEWNNGEYETGSNDDQVDIMTIATPHKRTKRNCNIDASEYSIFADIRPNNKGGENLFYENHKFNKNNGANQNGYQRWACVKQGSKVFKCRAAMSSMNIDGVTMMKTVIREHTHEPAD